MRGRAQAHGGVAGHAADRLLALLVGAAQQQVGDAFLGQDVGDVVAVDHHRRNGIRPARPAPGIELLDEGRLHVLAEGLHHLHHQLLAARDGVAAGARLLAGLEPGRAGVAAAARIGAHVGAPPKPAMRPAVAVELLPCKSICRVEPMNMSQA
jgi:hypothetical protein